jgi:tripartite-type tricarboxylate transporter receptor subunit TctC
MSAISRRQLLIGAAASLAAAAVGPVRAEPQKILYVAYPPGGSLDAMARSLAQGLGERQHDSIIVDNMPGFSGNIGAEFVSRSRPDGNTMLMTALTTYAISATLMEGKTGYDLIKNFEQVAIVGYLPNVLIVPASLHVDDVQSFIKAAKAKPDAFSYATTGVGSLEHIAGEMFKRAAGIQMEPVHYKGSAPGMTDLLADRIQAMFVNTSTAINNLKTGLIKVIGIAGPHRVGALPGVPTLREAGVHMDNDVVSIFGIAVPAKTPQAAVNQLNADVNAVMKLPDVRQRFEIQGIEIVTESVAYATQRVETEVATWRKVIKETGITLQT